MKNELEDYLTKLKIILSSCEDTFKAIDNYEKKRDELKDLYYLALVQKNKEKVKEFLKEKIQNKFFCVKSDSYLSYDTYYFNGIPIPTDLKVEQKGKQLYISWDIDDSIIKGDDIKNIKYNILIKGNTFDSDKETENKYFYFDNCRKNTNYEIKVRSVINYCYTEWSEIKTFKYENETELISL